MPSASMGTTVLGTSSTLLVSNSPNRIGLVFTVPPTNRYTLSLNPTVVQDVGLTMFTTSQPVILTLQDHGDMVRSAWYAITPVGQTVAFFEWFP